ncbi:MAG: UDP-N-acetylmuramoyl-L-alanyl-D-glutamate--2,6-diaminopimelate ligase [Actinomycetota bacterium]
MPGAFSAPISLPTAVPLRDLLAPLPHAQVVGEADMLISGISYRSKELEPGSLFFAVRGDHTDGHDHAAEAVANGAVVVVAERPLETGATEVIVPSVREAMGPVAGSFFGRPSDAMVVVGVTGTNGKTTTTYLLERVLEASGAVPGMIGTTGVRVDGRVVGYDRTTPEAPDIHRILYEMREQGVGGVAMEVSSHGLDQHRVGGIRFSCAVFTNLSQDHLDYHGDMDRYLRAKAMLFTPDMAERAAINNDSPEGRSLAGRVPTLTFGVGEGAELRAENVSVGPEGVSFRAGGVEVRSRLRGAFNVSNCLATLAAARQVGIPAESAAEGIAQLRGVPGRMEPVEAGQPFEVLVDYAHTPDSLENVLRAARDLAAGNRVIAVFGCGGDRDRGKRPLMGEAATRHADLSVVTSDNPRSEEPEAIVREIEEGARNGGGAYTVEVDRRAAIRLALAEASAGDIVVIAGKGHETGQEFADRTIPFDDRIVAREEIETLLEDRG